MGYACMGVCCCGGAPVVCAPSELQCSAKLALTATSSSCPCGVTAVAQPDTHDLVCPRLACADQHSCCLLLLWCCLNPKPRCTRLLVTALASRNTCGCRAVHWHCHRTPQSLPRPSPLQWR